MPHQYDIDRGHRHELRGDVAPTIAAITESPTDQNAVPVGSVLLPPARLYPLAELFRDKVGHAVVLNE